MSATIPKTIERGAALLDKKHPGWVEKIDLDRLDLNRGRDCIIGQQHPRAEQPYYYGLEVLGLTWADSGKFGFDVGIVKSHSRLTESWRRLIEKRRAA